MLHTDDLAWNHGVFAWDELLRDDVLPGGPGRGAAGLPAAAVGRPGAVRTRSPCPAGSPFLVVEGVGASQASVRDAYDVVIWVETEEPTRLGPRPAPAGGRRDVAPEAYERWMAEENAYTTRERPWEHADLLVYGGESIPHDPETEVVLARDWPQPT